jgi:hypothetical protein
MKLREALQLFKENVVGGTINAPDNYREWDTGGYRVHRENLLHYWNEAKPMIKHDIDKVAIIDEKLRQALESFDRGDREPGQSLMVEIYNVLNLNTLK